MTTQRQRHDQGYSSHQTLGSYPQYQQADLSQNHANKHRDAFGNGAVNPFADAAIRQLFVRKVFSLLACMVLTTTAAISVFIYSESVQMYVATNRWLLTACTAVYLGSALAISFCTELRRKHPTNIVLLTIFTLSTSFMLAVVCSLYTVESVALAGGITAITCAMVATLAATTKVDFTRWYGLFLSFFWVLFIGKLLFSFALPVRDVDKVYASLGAGLFILILIVDIQMIMGGKRMVVNPEEYVFAAMQVYLDIVNIFLEILKLVGKLKDSERSKDR